MADGGGITLVRRCLWTFENVVLSLLMILVILPSRWAWQYTDTIPRHILSVESLPPSVQSFKGSLSESHFKVLQLDGEYMIVGAKNFMYNISLETFTLKKSISWAADRAQTLTCQLKQRTEAQCQNYIRVIAKKDDTHVFLCGTNSYNPKCRTYKITDGGYEWLARSDESGIAKCPFNPDHNSTYIYTDGNLYSGTMVEFNYPDPLIYRRPMRTVEHYSQWLNDPDFVGSFEHGDKVYFFFREVALEYINCGKAVFSRVAQICKTDKGGGSGLLPNVWTSFFKARLNCSVPGEYPFYFDEILGVSEMGLGNYRALTEGELAVNRTKMVYAVFNTPSNSIRGSAVCAFRMSDILAAFEGNFKEQKTPRSSWLPVKSTDIPSPHPARGCHTDSHLINDMDLDFIKSHPLMDQAVPAFGGAPVLVHTGFDYRLTTVAVDWQFHASDGKYYDIIFAGTDDGKLIKSVNRAKDNQVIPVIIDEIQVFSKGVSVMNVKVHRPAQGQAKVIVMSRHEIKSLPLSHCSKAKTCSECVQLQDPYCSWQQTNCTDKVERFAVQNIPDGVDSRCERVHVPSPKAATTVVPSTCRPCICPTPATQSTRHTPVTTPNDNIVPPRRTHRTKPPEVPRTGNGLGEESEKETPMTGANTRPQIQQPGYTATTLALGVCLSILLSLVVGFVLGYFFRKRRHETSHPPEDIPEKDNTIKARNKLGTLKQNVYADPAMLNSEKNFPEKQVNVLYNPLKNNTNLPNGGAEHEVQPSTSPKKQVYL